MVSHFNQNDANGAAMLLHLKDTEDLLHDGEHRLHQVCRPKTILGSVGRAAQEKGTMIMYFEKYRYTKDRKHEYAF